MSLRTVVIAALLATPLVAQTLPRAVTDHDYAPQQIEEAALGHLLFYDPILSGNRNIACASCHHPAFGTADGVALSLGEGAIGMGPKRRVDPANPPVKRIPRNAPALFNLGAHEFTVMFHDGRLEADPIAPSGIRTPMDADMVTGFASVLSAQTMFPVLSRDEMAGDFNENEIGRAVRQGVITGEGGAWDLIARRVANIPAYAAAFQQTYAHINAPADIAFTDISNAIAMFMAVEWRSDTSPFDQHLRGEAALTGPAQRGMELFYGPAQCADCHSGPFQTDHQFHAMAAPQIGPGKAATFETHNRDEGRFRVTGDPVDLYAFRTPSLRNVALTGPYGHAGSHHSLREFVTDHLDPAAALARFETTSVQLPAFDTEDFNILTSQIDRDAIRDAVTRAPVSLTDTQITEILAFLDALTDPAAINGRMGVPNSVPSGLPVSNPE